MRNNPLIGRNGFWLRQLSDTSERTFPRVIQTIKAAGGDLLCQKVADGLYFQTANDPSTPVGSIDQIVALQKLCHDNGVAFCPVVVPRGVKGEAEFHGAIASALGCLMTDIEPYDGFWDKTDKSLIPVYANYLRQASGNAFLINQPDPRKFSVDQFCVREPAPFFDAIAAQHYVGWASVGWTSVGGEVSSYAYVRQFYPDSYVTLYGVERTDLAEAFYRQVQGVSRGLHTFALGPMNGEQLRQFGALPRPTHLAEPLGELPDPEEPPVAQMHDLVAAWAQAIGIPLPLAFMVVWGESAFRANATGDGGQSHGLVQVHGRGRANWIGWAGAARSLEFVQDRWKQTYAKRPFTNEEVYNDPAGVLLAFWAAAQGADYEGTKSLLDRTVAGGLQAYREWYARQPQPEPAPPPMDPVEPVPPPMPDYRKMYQEELRGKLEFSDDIEREVQIRAKMIRDDVAAKRAALGVTNG